MSLQKKYLIIVAGPTAVGKTRLAIRLARHYGTAILSTDSRQFYKEMNIGTAKPSREEQSQVVHHLIDFLSVQQAYHVKEFEENALQVLQHLFAKGDIALATGGSGLYIKILCEGIDEMPEISSEVRKRWEVRWQQEGLEALALLLKEKDPVYYQNADIKNPRRVLRALEVMDVTGRPFSEFRKKHQNHHPAARNFHTLKIGLKRERKELYERIDRRVDQMVAAGLIEEARNLYPYRHHHALQTVGYQELFPYFEQQYGLEEAVRLIKRNSRRYAKRQMTWFRKDENIQWFDLSGQDEEQVLLHIISHVDEMIKNLKSLA